MVKSEDFLPAASGLDGIEWTEDTPKLILSYGDAAAERHSALTGAFLKDVRAARVIRTEGENGEKLLRRLITADVAKHATGDCLLASMLNASGGVMQEVAVIAHTGYWDVVLFPETADTGLAWSRQVAVSFEAEVEQPEDRHVFWLGGPLASDTLKKVDCAVPKAGSFTEPEAGVQVCAFEDIFLIQGETAKLDAFWKKLAAAGAAPIGEEAWEAARTAICLPAFGCDYDESSSPLEVGLGSSVDFSDPARMFIGRALTEARYRAGIRCRLGVLEIQSEDDASKLDSAPEGVLRGNSSEGGIITTWTVSDSGTILALALLPAESHIGDEAEVSYRAGGEDRVCAGKVIRLR